MLKRPDVSNLVTKTALTTVENKISDVNNLVKKTDYDTKIIEIENKVNNHNHDEYITHPEFNTLATDVFTARLAQENLVPKTDFDAKLLSLNKKITENKTKHLLDQNELNKLKTIDSSYFIGKSHFEEDGAKDYLVFQPLFRYFELNVSTGRVSSWKSKGLSAETIELPSTSNNNISPQLDFYGGGKLRVELTGSCLKQPNISQNHKKVVHIYNVYELGASGSNNSDPTLKKCLLGAVTLTKNADIEKYGYSGILDLIEKQASHFLVVDLVKIY